MTEAEKWNQKVDHPLQSWEWGEFRKKRQPISRTENMLVIWTKIKHTPWYFGYIPMGVGPNKKEIEDLKKLGQARKAIGIRIEPNTEKDKGDYLQNLKLKKGRNLFKSKTIVIDLTQSEEQLQKDMHPKGRYNIKVAQKHDVEIKEDNSDAAFERYLELMFGGTAKRQRVYFHSHEYHRQMWAALKEKTAHLFTASYEGKVIAANIIFTFKDKAYYAYGATALENKEVMAPTLLLWEVIRWSKKKGYKIFDLWGQEEGTGFSRFKEQFGGTTIETAGTYDIVVNPLLYPIFRLAEEARWKMLHGLK